MVTLLFYNNQMRLYSSEAIFGTDAYHLFFIVEDPVYEDENAGNVRANGHIPLGGLNGISNGIQWRLSNRDHQNNARTNEWLQNNPIPSSNGVLPNASNHSNNNNANSNSGGGSSASSFLSRPRVPLWTRYFYYLTDSLWKCLLNK